jgi:ComF family protein
MSFIDKLIGNIAPYDCVGCGYEGLIACADCLAGLTALPERCYRCARLSRRSYTCEACGRSSGLRQVHVATAYGDLAKKLVWQLKFHGVQAGARVMAGRMAPLALAKPQRSALLVPVPTATSRARGRGYDQAKLLARELSRQTGLPYADCLGRSGQTHQVGASRAQRQRQLQQAFRLKPRKTSAPRAIILVDDVLTTGATLEAAAATFSRAGFKEIRAIVFAQA